MKHQSKYHQPVMLKEAVGGLNICENGVYVDVTFGGGGHARAILEQLKDGHLFAFDQDESARSQLPSDSRITFIHHNFKFLKRFLRYYDVIPVQGILADLGVASFQLDTAEKGFSVKEEGPLDMRMDSDLEVTAADIVNHYEKEGLVKVFSQYGEVRNSKTLARRIIAAREEAPIRTIRRFKKVIDPVVPKKYINRYRAQVFQALRIEVNDELNNLKKFLKQSAQVLEKEGRLVVISYHSLEDRLVKRFTRKGKFENTPSIMSPKRESIADTPPLAPINKKPITPTEKEVKQNRRARSAKLRIAQKVTDDKK